VVRVALGVTGGAALTVRGEIAVRKSADEVPFVIASDNVVVVGPAETGNLPLKREDATRTLNFVVPDATEGPLHIELTGLEDSVSGSALGFGAPVRRVVWFHASPPMRLRVIGFRYQQDGVTHVPTPRDFAWLRSWVARAYPAGLVIATTGMTDATAAVEFSCGDINAQLAAMRVLDMDAGGDERTHYYGLVSDGGFFMRGCAAVPANPAPDAVGSGPTGPGTWGWDFDGSYGDWYGGHELGHTYGRRHPGFCGESVNDLDNYPFANGQLANGNDSFVGFDVGDPANAIAMRALPGTQWHDVMTYCNFQWLSAYTYLGIRRRLADEDALGPAGDGGAGASPGGGRPDARFPAARPPAGQALSAAGARGEPAASAAAVPVSVVATINLDGLTGSIRYLNPLSKPRRAVDTGADAVLRLVDEAGATLADVPVAARLDSELCAGDARTGIIDAVVMVPPQARAIRLMIDDTLVDERAIGGGLPEATLETSVPAAAGTDRAADTHYTVQASRDGGTSWETLATGLETPAFDVERDQFPSGQAARIRVIGTNGRERWVVSERDIGKP
jgi:hypothetical protein